MLDKKKRMMINRQKRFRSVAKNNALDNSIDSR